MSLTKRLLLIMGLLLSSVLLFACGDKASELDKVKDALTYESILNTNVSKDEVKSDLTLTLKEGNVTITWSSSNVSVITDAGKVVREAQNVVVTLTANLSLEDKTAKKEFELTVLALDEVITETFTVTFNVEGGSEVAAQTVDKDSKATKPVDPTKDGFTFLGWFIDDVAFDFDTAITKDTTLVAKWEETVTPVTKYTVTFNVDGGSEVAVQTVDKDSKATKPADPTKDGFAFKGWLLDDVAFDFNTAITKDTTLVAKWEEIVIPVTKYTVTFDSNGGTAIDSQTIEEGSKATKPVDPTKDGFTFLGWFIDDVAFDFNTEITKDTTLIAKWETDEEPPVTKYTVKFVDHDDTLIKEELVEEGSSATAPTNPTRVGYTFDKWDKAFTNIVSDLTVKAIYTKDEEPEPVVEYTVTFNTEGGSAIDSQTVEEGSKANKPVDPTRDGFTFLGWFLDDLVFDFNTEITNDTTLIAKWEENTPEPEGVVTTAMNPVSITMVEGVNYAENFGLDPEIFTVNVKKNNANNISFSNDSQFRIYNSSDKDGSSFIISIKDNYEIINITIDFNQVDLVGIITDNGVSNTIDPEVGMYVLDDLNTKSVEIKNIGSKQIRITQVEIKYLILEESEPKKEYTVVFNTNGGSNIVAEKVAEGSKATKPANPTKDGFTFLGWFLEDVEFDFEKAITEDTTLVAEWEAVKELSDLEKVNIVKDELVELYADKSFDMGTKANLPSTGTYNTAIVWEFNPENAVVEGNWNDVNEDTTYMIIVTVTLGESEVDDIFEIIVKFVNSSEPVSKQATMEFGNAKYTNSDTAQNGNRTIDGLAVSVSSSTAFWDGNSSNSLRLGSSKNEGSLTLTFDSSIKIVKVTIYASQYDGEVSVKVNDLAAQTVTNSTGSDYVGYEFNINELNSFKVSSVDTSKSRIQIQKIVIEYFPN